MSCAIDLIRGGHHGRQEVRVQRAQMREVKRTIRDMADVGTHPDAVERELTPQVWSTRQPWFAERIAALQQRISSK